MRLFMSVSKCCNRIGYYWALANATTRPDLSVTKIRPVASTAMPHRTGAPLRAWVQSRFPVLFLSATSDQPLSLGAKDSTALGALTAILLHRVEPSYTGEPSFE